MSWRFLNGLKFRPINGWPGPHTPKRGRAPFRVAYDRTIADLAREIAMLSGGDVFCLANCDASHLRADGGLRADANLPSPGIVLVVGRSRVGPFQMPCDRYDRWQDNLRAIALSLAALRAVDRHGCTRRGEQYRGWQALPPGSGTATFEWTSAESAAEWLRDQAGMVASVGEIMADPRAAYIAAIKRVHPDHPGGDAELAARVNRCRDFLQGVGR